MTSSVKLKSLMVMFGTDLFGNNCIKAIRLNLSGGHTSPFFEAREKYHVTWKTEMTLNRPIGAVSCDEDLH